MARSDPRPNYGSKRRIHMSGYVDVYDPTHVLSRSDGYLFEHRRMAWDADMFDEPELQVHHINGIKTDNRLENFEILTVDAHALFHAEDRGYVVNQYGMWPVKPREKRVNAPKPARSCLACGADVPATKRRDARYCSSRCRVGSWKRANRLVAR